MKKLILFLLPVSVAAQDFPADTVEPRKLYIDQDSLHAELSFDVEDEKVTGAMVLHFTAPAGTDSIWLDAMPSITLTNRPLLNGEPVQWRRAEKGIVLYAEEWMDFAKGQIELAWEARPYKGIFFNGWNDPANRARKQIFTQGQGTDHRHWLPHVDAQNDKLKTSFAITFDSDYRVLANGQLLAREEKDNGTTRWHYALSHPHSSYLMAIVIGEYSVKQDSGRSVLREQYIYPDKEDDYEWTYHANDKIWDSINQRIGVPFPWKNYRQVPVANFPHGGMENTTITIYADQFIVDEQTFDISNYIYVNAHELAHHWFGDYITAPSAKDFWLHEGFATYYQQYAQGVVFGSAAFAAELESARAMVELADQQDAYPLRHSKAGSARFYQKGGLTLRALESNLGREVFDRGVRIFLEENAYGIVTTNDFQASMEKACACNLDDFVEEWIEKPFWPAYRVDLKTESGEIIFTPEAIENPDRSLPVRHLTLRVWKSPDNFVDYDINLNDKNTYRLPWEENEILFWEVDPLQKYPFRWKIEMNSEQWQSALKYGSVITQYRAVKALRNVHFDDLKELYAGLIAGDIHYSVADSLYQHWFQESPDDIEALLKILWEKGPSARAMNFVALRSSPQKKTTPYFGDIVEKADPNTALLAFFQLIGAFPGRVDEWLELAGNREGDNDETFNSYRAMVIAKVKGANNGNGLPVLLDYASAAHPDNLRILAWDILNGLEVDNREWRSMVYKETISRHRHLRNKAVSIVKSWLADEKEREKVLAEMEFDLQLLPEGDIQRVERTLGVELKQR